MRNWRGSSGNVMGIPSYLEKQTNSAPGHPVDRLGRFVLPGDEVAYCQRLDEGPNIWLLGKVQSIPRDTWLYIIPNMGAQKLGAVPHYLDPQWVLRMPIPLTVNYSVVFQFLTALNAGVCHQTMGPNNFGHIAGKKIPLTNVNGSV